MTLGDRPPTQMSLSTRWLWGVRTAAGLSTLPLCVTTFRTLFPGFRDPCADQPGASLLVLIPLTAPYLHIQFELGRRTQKRGLALAVVTGSVWFVIGILIVWVWLTERKISEGLVKGLLTLILTLTQAALVASAIKTYYAMAREPRDRRALGWGFGAFLIYACTAAFFAISLPSLVRSAQGANQASAVGSLRTINAAQITYWHTYGSGYSASLAALGPPPPGAPPTPAAAGLVDDTLASGKKSGYIFTYTPGPRDATGKITAYTVVARSNCQNWRSFFIDDTGVIRVTNENRPATAQDPPIG